MASSLFDAMPHFLVFFIHLLQQKEGGALDMGGHRAADEDENARICNSPPLHVLGYYVLLCALGYGTESLDPQSFQMSRQSVLLRRFEVLIIRFGLYMMAPVPSRFY
jgi:hypothetical protein